MKKTTQIKLLTFIIAGMMFSANAYSQIVYTDVNPDTTVIANNTIYNLDLNNDGIIDFRIRKKYFYLCPPYGLNGTTYTDIEIDALNGNGVSNDSNNYPKKISYNNVIKSGGTFWLSTPGQILAKGTKVVMKGRFSCYTLPTTTYYGKWNAVNDKYLGLRVSIGVNQYYGWVRLNVASGGTSVTIKDYAYDSTPNHSIHAGDMSGARIMNPTANYFTPVSPSPILQTYETQVHPSKIIQIPKVDTSKPLQFKNNAGGSELFTEERENKSKRRITPEVDVVNHPEENNNANMRVSDCPNPPVVHTSFEGNPQSQLFLFPYYGPSECNIAISNAGKIVSISATWMRYYNENGILVFSDSLYHFGNGLIDCHVLYDPKSDRFVFSSGYGYYNADPFILDGYGTLIGFSKSNDPMDGWNLYQIPFTDFHDNSTADYDLLAISDSEVFITLNYFKGTDKYKHVEILQINKGEGYSGAASLSLQRYDAPLLGSTKGTMVPAQGGSTTYGPNMYFIMSNENGNSSNKYYVYEITNTMASGQAVLNRYGTVSSNLSYFGSGVSYQPGGIILFDPNAPHQDYLQNAFYENGLIQFCQHTKANGKAAAYIGRISGIPNNLNCVAKTISDAKLYLAFPSIVYVGNSSTDNSAIVGIEHTGVNTYPGLSAAFVSSDFEVSSLVTIKAGNDTINGLWGDYSGTCRRYNHPGECWFEGQYGSTSANKINWITKLQSPPPCYDRNASEKFGNDLTITPNPFSNSASIYFTLSQSENVTVRIYDMNGRLIKTLADNVFEEGEHSMEWNAENENAGFYFLKLETVNYSQTKKLSVAR